MLLFQPHPTKNNALLLRLTEKHNKSTNRYNFGKELFTFSNTVVQYTFDMNSADEYWIVQYRFKRPKYPGSNAFRLIAALLRLLLGGIGGGSGGGSSRVVIGRHRQRCFL